MQQTSTNGYRYWDFIEDGSFDWPHATPEEQVYFREVAAAFLRVTFDPPAGYVIDVLEAGYCGSRFPIIALGWNHDPEPLSLNDRQEFIRRLVVPLDRFVRSVDWDEVARIRNDIAQAPGVVDFKRLLERQAGSVPLAQRCLSVLSDEQTRIYLAPRPLDSAHLRDAYAKRSDREEAANKQYGRIVETSEPKLPALSRMADAGQLICVHSLETREEHFFVITDAALRRLILIEAIRDQADGSKKDRAGVCDPVKRAGILGGAGELGK